MAIVTSYDWESDTWTHNGDHSARQAWRAAVAEIAAKAHEKLPECNGRVDSAVKLVLAGDVELLVDGTAKVASQSNGTTTYHIVNGHCDCKDFAKAPHNLCKHRLSAAIMRRAQELAKQRLEQLDHASNSGSQPPVETPQGLPQGEPVPALPEAPASANVHVTLAGRTVQVTLRDTDEQRLLARLEALLQRFPAEEEPEGEQASPEGWCSKHGVQMKLRNGEHGSWWSHKTPQGWCKGK
jgi:hypothetical protein